jgi:muramoyltetrapeptide carboxypeptidase LdcA involved in peptidoglycan recycling
MAHTLRDDAWLHDHPQARADDLMQAFLNPEIKAIISTIGGNDSIRLLPYLDLDVMRDNPKIFMGYSDTAISHMAGFTAGLVSFYGPAIMAGFGENGGLFAYMVDSVCRTLFSSVPIGPILPNEDGWTVELLDWADADKQSQKRRLNPCGRWRFLQGRGVHRGPLIGGCFNVLDWLRGSNFWPDLGARRGAILFLETDEDAPPPKVFKYGLRTYAALGILQQLSGIFFGRPGPDPQTFSQYDDVLRLVVAEEEGLMDLTIITQMDFGHTDPMFVLPYGVQAEINCGSRQLTILENAVVD